MPPPSLGEVLDRKLTRAKLKGSASLRTMEWNVRAIAEDLPRDMPAKSVTEVRLEQFVASKLTKGWKPASINRLLAFLRSALNIAHKSVDEDGNRLLDRVPTFELLQENNVRQTMPTYDDYQAILRELAKAPRQVPGTLPRLFTFYRITGYRKNEPLRLTWDRVDQFAEEIQLPKYDTKSKQWRAAWPYGQHPELRQVVKEQWEAKLETERDRRAIIAHVFFKRTGKPIRSFRGAWQYARAAIGKPYLWVHDFRRVAARDLVKSRVDRKTAKALIGAKTDSIFERYHIVTTDDVRDAAQQLARYHAVVSGEASQRRLFGRAG